MTWVPADRLASEKFATPPINGSASPALTPSSENWTVPVGVPWPANLDATVAVKFAVCP